MESKRLRTQMDEARGRALDTGNCPVHCWHETGSGANMGEFGGKVEVACCHCPTLALVGYTYVTQPIPGHGPHAVLRVRQFDQIATRPTLRPTVVTRNESTPELKRMWDQIDELAARARPNVIRDLIDDWHNKRVGNWRGLRLNDSETEFVQKVLLPMLNVGSGFHAD